MRGANRRANRSAIANTAISILAGAALAACSNTPTQPPPEDTVQLEGGAARGQLVDGARIFLNLPYAAPPVGALRWQPPQPAAPWTGTRDATVAGNSCPQPASILFTIANTDEDCLHVNVFTPRPAPTAAPVMVWIHGGAFLFGSGDEPAYDGTALARAGVVVVTMNYRLGALGFFAHHALSTADPSHPTSGNQGFEDQRAALEWVQRNISAFGGDPKNVTLFGESAGAVSVWGHIVSPASKGLFQRAIAESTVGSPFPLLSQSGAIESAEAHGARFAAALGCDTNADPIACLRGKNADQIIRTLPLNGTGNLDLTYLGNFQNVWWPVVDGVDFPDQIEALLRRGAFTPMPILAGTNTDEGSLWEGGVASDMEYMTALSDAFGAHAMDVANRYPSSQLGSPALAATAVWTDSVMACPTRRWLRDVLAASAPAFRYHFEHTPEKPLLPNRGVYHTAEIAYVFRHQTVTDLGRLQSDELPLADTIIGYWTRFATSANPNGPSSVPWPSYSMSDPYLILDKTQSAAMGLNSSNCDFWDSLAP